MNHGEIARLRTMKIVHNRRLLYEILRFADPGNRIVHAFANCASLPLSLSGPRMGSIHQASIQETERTVRGMDDLAEYFG